MTDEKSFEDRLRELEEGQARLTNHLFERINDLSIQVMRLQSQAGWTETVVRTLLGNPQ